MVVCSGNNKDMELLLSLVARVHSGDQELIPFHTEAVVASHHPVKLFAARSLPRKQAVGELSCCVLVKLAWRFKTK